MTFRKEVRHERLRRARIIEGADPFTLRQKAAAQLQVWRDLWDGAPDTPPVTLEEGRLLAEHLTEDAQRELALLGELLGEESTLAEVARPEPEAFPEPPPEPPHLPDPKPKPSRTESRFRPELTLSDRVLVWKKREKEEEAERRFWAAWAAWQDEEKEVQDALMAHQARFEEWDRRRLGFEAEQRRRLKAREEVEARRAEGVPSAVTEYFANVLSSAERPRCFPAEMAFAYDPSSEILTLELQLPAPGDLPSLARVRFRESEQDYLEEHLSESDQDALYDSVVYQWVIQSLRLLFSADRFANLRAVTLNGWVDARDHATGETRKIYILALEVAKARFPRIDPERVNPERCFEALGGLKVGSPHELRAIAPLAGPAVHPPAVSGPSAMDGRSEPSPQQFQELSPRDFQHLMVRLVEDQITPVGTVVELTVLREDGSLEAIARGAGKVGAEGAVVIHVTSPGLDADVSDVRELMDRLKKVNGKRGILLAPSAISASAWKTAQGGAITLFDGDAIRDLLAQEGSRDRGFALPGSGEPDSLGLGPQ